MFEANLWLEVPTSDDIKKVDEGVIELVDHFKKVVIMTNVQYINRIAYWGKGIDSKVVVGGLKVQNDWLEKNKVITIDSIISSPVILDVETVMSSNWLNFKESDRIFRRIANNLPQGDYIWGTVPAPVNEARDNYTRKIIDNLYKVFITVGHKFRLLNAKYGRPDNDWTWDQRLSFVNEVPAIWCYHETINGIPKLIDGYWNIKDLKTVIHNAVIDEDLIGDPYIYTGMAAMHPIIVEQLIQESKSI